MNNLIITPSKHSHLNAELNYPQSAEQFKLLQFNNFCDLIKY